MPTILKPSTSSRTSHELVVRLANSTRTLVFLALVMTGSAAALAMSEWTATPAEKPTLEVCPACVADLWFTPAEPAEDQ